MPCLVELSMKKFYNLAALLFLFFSWNKYYSSAIISYTYTLNHLES